MYIKEITIDDLEFSATFNENGLWLEIIYDNGCDAHDITGTKDITKLRDFLTEIINKEGMK